MKIRGPQITLLASYHPKKGSQLHPRTIFHLQKTCISNHHMLCWNPAHSKKGKKEPLDAGAHERPEKPTLENSLLWDIYAGSIQKSPVIRLQIPPSGFIHKHLPATGS
eukprot:1157203-Pelagomonas_calceolata.AAC.11